MKRTDRYAILLVLLLVLQWSAFAQVRHPQPAQSLPTAPVPQNVLSQVSLSQAVSTQTGTSQPGSPQTGPPQTSPATGSNAAANAQTPTAPPGTLSLTLQQAEAYAIKNNPQV